MAAVVTAWVAAVVVVSGCGDNLVPLPDAPPCMVSITDPGSIATFASTRAVRSQTGGGKQTIAFLGALQPGPDADTLDIQLIEGMGALSGGPPAAGSYALGGADVQLSTCGVCVVLEGGTPRSYFAAQKGTLAIEAVDTRFKTSLSNVELAHVDVDTVTSVSTIADSCLIHITAASWDTTIE